MALQVAMRRAQVLDEYRSVKGCEAGELSVVQVVGEDLSYDRVSVDQQSAGSTSPDVTLDSTAHVDNTSGLCSPASTTPALTATVGRPSTLSFFPHTSQQSPTDHPIPLRPSLLSESTTTDPLQSMTPLPHLAQQNKLKEDGKPYSTNNLHAYFDREKLAVAKDPLQYLLEMFRLPMDALPLVWIIFKDANADYKMTASRIIEAQMELRSMVLQEAASAAFSPSYSNYYYNYPAAVSYMQQHSSQTPFPDMSTDMWRTSAAFLKYFQPRRVFTESCQSDVGRPLANSAPS